ncbi:alpha/beta-hydrolase [Agrocybe pediades]|nr:alpha/beta-hydrolase [Agrocybe pediades]
MAPAKKQPRAPSSQDDEFVSSIPTVFSPETRLRRGLCPVTALQESTTSNKVIDDTFESHSLYYEQHGPARINLIKDEVQRQKEIAKLRKVVFIMGLNSSCFGWSAQVKWFSGMTRPSELDGQEDYTALVFDNRGVGNSGYPRGPYTTSGMAEDVICLLDYLGWTGERDLTIVGISMGGMIAQELAYRIPTRISSMVLAVTTPGGHFWQNLPPLKGVTSLAKLIVTPEAEKKAPIVMEMLFPIPWLEETAVDDSGKRRTNREIQTEGFHHRFSLTTPQRFLGHISQMAAGLTHHVSPSRLSDIAANVPKIIILTGDEDNLVRPSGSMKIWHGMTGKPPPADVLREAGDETDGEKGRIELIQWKGTGHAIHAQRALEFNLLVERCVQEGRGLVDGGFLGRDQPSSDSD